MRANISSVLPSLPSRGATPLAAYVAALALYGYLQLNRRYVKRYLNVETPLYKWWWKLNAAAIQRALDAQPQRLFP